MKARFLLATLAAALLLAAATHLKSQNPPTPAKASAATALTQIKADNEKIIARQKAIIQQLDQITEEARQIKAFSKRG